MVAKKNTSDVKCIAFVNTSTSWGGGELWHGQMALKMHALGWETHVLCAPDSALANWLVGREFPKDQIHVVYSKNADLISLSARQRVRRILRKTSPDHIILNSPIDVKMVAPIARKLGVRDIVYRRGTALPVRNTWLNRWLLNSCVHRFIANSHATSETLMGNGTISQPEHRISLQYNGVDVCQFVSPINERVGDGESITIGALGRLTYQKGFDVLVEAMALVVAEHPHVVLRIGGVGEERESLQQLVKQLKLEDSVELVGFVDNTPKFFQSIDLFCLPSRWEGFGFVLVEAMSSGLACVAFDVSNVSEIVVDGQTGVLVEEQTPEAFARALGNVISQRHLLQDLGEAGQARATNLFSLEKSVDRFVHFLQSSNTDYA